MRAIAETIALASTGLFATQAGASWLGICRLRAPHLRARATDYRAAGQARRIIALKARLFDG
ncbi:hypothetical protein [Mesorhizobium loti]|uniref:Uncharacterized protein n=1 Tax=Mesorhizobium loti R88b TaxID=935548 RepID=A0A6M7WK55_RHILI|nr:hypothetical protein [Mesorhizobium loti]QKD04380.1 hypothetical protein EB235_25235 [Mesorhizobium loti R88b]